MKQAKELEKYVQTVLNELNKNKKQNAQIIDSFVDAVYDLADDVIGRSEPYNNDAQAFLEGSITDAKCCLLFSYDELLLFNIEEEKVLESLYKWDEILG